MSRSKTSSNKSTAGQAYVISAASGTGKSTLVNRLLADLPGCALSVSYTTRPPRPGEVDGREYFFVTPETFQRMIRRGEFLEHATVHGRQYGTSRRQVKESLRVGLDVLLDIDVQGAAQVRKKMPEAEFVFILPPSMQALRERLLRRATEDSDGMAIRLKNAVKEIRHSGKYDYLLVNEALETAVEHLKSILLANRLRLKRAKKSATLERFPIFSEIRKA